MLEYKNIEDELDSLLFTTEKDLDIINTEIENIKIIEKDLLNINHENKIKNPLILSELKNNLNQREEIYENLKYLKYYQALFKLEEEKKYYTKLDIINKLNIDLKELKDYSNVNSYNFEDYALVRTLRNILDLDFNEIDQFLIDIKFPIFDNSIIPNHLDSILSKSLEAQKLKEFGFFYDYLVLLNDLSLVKNINLNNSETDKNRNTLLNNLEFNDIISEFLIKKIHFSITSKSFIELEKLVKEKKQTSKTNENINIDNIEINCDNEIEKFFIDFLENIISYIKKCFENLRDFLSYCYSLKLNNINKNLNIKESKQNIISEKDFINKMNHYLIFILEKLNFYLLKVFTENKNFVLYVSKSNYISFKFLKLFIEFEKNLKKQFHSKDYNLSYSVSDIFIYNEKCLLKLQEIIFIQKNFTENYFQDNIANAFSETFDKENSANLFIENTLFEKLKLIIRDNFFFLNAFERSTDIFSVIYEENYKSFIKELLNFLKNIYNKQVSYFSTSRKINKFNILYLIDFTIKILCLKNKMLKKVKRINWHEINKNKFYDHSEMQRLSNQSIMSIHNISLLNNKICKINNENFIENNISNTNNILFFEGLNILNNFIVLLTKEFKEKSFCQLIDIFEYGNLVNLDEEKIDTICHNCSEDLKNLVFYIDSSNINREYEYIIYEIILSDVLVHINRELDNSLKRKPKNKVFNHLVDRIKNIMNLLISKFNRKEELRKDEDLKTLIKNFNSYMNILKLYALS